MYQAMKLNNLNFTEEKNEKKGRKRKMTLEDEYEFLMQKKILLFMCNPVTPVEAGGGGCPHH